MKEWKDMKNFGDYEELGTPTACEAQTERDEPEGPRRPPIAHRKSLTDSNIGLIDQPFMSFQTFMSSSSAVVFEAR
jgi:hypothetical protein